MKPEPLHNQEQEQPRQRLQNLRSRLLALHKILVEKERHSYESTFGTLASPNQLLQLLIKDPWFAWLHPISELVVSIDETLDEKEPITKARADRLIHQTRMQLKASQEGDNFQKSYYEALQEEPDVVMAHAEVAKCLKEK